MGEQPRLAYADVKRALAFLVAGGLIVGGVVMLLRPVDRDPDPSPAVAAAQVAEGVGVDEFRSYDEATGWWLVWYLGPLAVALGIGGLALLVIGAAEEAGRRSLPFLGLALILGLVTMIDAGGDPIQAAASRRLIVIVIPALLIGGAALLHRLYLSTPDGPNPLVLALGTGAAVVAMVPLLHLLPVADLSSHRGLRAGIEQLCDEIERDDVVLFVERPSSRAGAVAVQTVRGFCRVPAARAIEPSAAEIEDLAEAWKAEGRDLMLVAEEPPAGLVGSVEVAMSWQSLEETVESRPDAATRGSLVIYLAPAE